METPKTPWQPLYSIERSGVTELSVTGILAVVAFPQEKSDLSARQQMSVAPVHPLIAQGDIDYSLWTRSLLKPIQLASHFLILRETYPDLKPEHFALMCSSHSCEDFHVSLLREIMDIGQISAEKLRCPAAMPQDPVVRERYKSVGKGPSPLYHNCSGKHFSYMLSLQAQGRPIDDYIALDNVEHKRVDELLSKLLRRPADSFAKTTDGCQLPNHGMSVREMAILYQHIAAQAGRLDDQQFAQVSENSSTDELLGLVGYLMNRFPAILGGTNRLDTKIMSGTFSKNGATKFLAKDGADGLLAIGVLPTERFKSGVGIVIKVASGYEIRHMEAIAEEILRLLGIFERAESSSGQSHLRSDHVKTSYSFRPR